MNGTRTGPGVLRLALALALCVALAPRDAARASDASEITLGAALSLTGRYASLGRQAREGYDLAVRVINDKGGVVIDGKPRRLRLVTLDDGGDPDRAAALTTRLIETDRVALLLGPYGSAATRAVANVAERHDAVLINANGADRDVFSLGLRHMFGVISTADFYLQPAVRLAGDLARGAGRDPKSLRVGLIVESDGFSRDVRAGVIEEMNRLGMKPVVDELLEPDVADLTASLIKARAVRPDLLVISAHDAGARLAVRQIADLKLDLPMVAITHCDGARLAEDFAGLSDYVFCPSQWDKSLPHRDRWFGGAADYALRFRTDYGHAPAYQSADASAAVVVLAEALGAANAADPAAVRAALARLDVTTFFGPVRFDAQGRNIAKPMVLYQIQAGDYRVVAPQAMATARPVWPTPPWSARN